MQEMYVDTIREKLITEKSTNSRLSTVFCVGECHLLLLCSYFNILVSSCFVGKGGGMGGIELELIERERVSE